MSPDEILALSLPFSPLSTGERNVGRLAKLAYERGFDWCRANRSDRLLGEPHWWNVVEAIAANFDWAKFEPLEVADIEGLPTIRHGCRRAIGAAVAMGREKRSQRLRTTLA